jgi:peptidoglycan/LPS O-acetylase OafA/YrhL
MINHSKSIDSNLSIYLNIVRGLAAFLVLAGHLRGFFFDTYNNLTPDSQNWFNYILFFITRIGHECVMVFFVLSGYLVGGNYLIDTINKKVSHKKYFLDRLTRMWTVLIPALLIGFTLDYYRCISLNDCYHVEEWSNSTFLGNVFFLQTIKYSIFTSNKALWSLANEFWYYILFPLISIPFSIKGIKIIKILIALGILGLFYFIMPNIINLFPIWLIGVGARFITPSTFFLKKKWLILTYILFAGSILFSNMHSTLLTNTMVGLLFSTLLILHRGNTLINFKILKKPANILSDFSFSMYAFHLPIMFLLLAFFKNKIGFDIRYTNAHYNEWLIYLVILTMLITGTYILYFLTEKNTYKLRTWLLNKIINTTPPKKT